MGAGFVSLGLLLLLVVLGGAALSFFQMVQISRLQSRLRELADELNLLKREDRVAQTPRSEAATANISSEPAPTVSPEPSAKSTAETTVPKSPPTPPVVTSAAALPPPPPPSSTWSMNFEDKLGSQLTVWIGGIALALGGIFLVKYSIDAGLLGPGMRVFLGGLLALILCGLGEYTLRQDVSGALAARLPKQSNDALPAYIPGVLTAAGLLTAFATAYSAYALYGFLGNTTAFGVLAILSFIGLSLSIRQGPGIAALGMLAGYATPALVSSNAPSAWSLFLYLTILTGAVYLTAWFRGWLRLAWIACACASAWAALWLLTTYKGGDAVAMVVFVLAVPALAVAFLRTETSPEASDDYWFDWNILPIFAANATIALLFTVIAEHESPTILTTAALCVMFIVTATRWTPWLPLAGLAGLLFGGHLLTWPNLQLWKLPSLSAFELIDDGRFLTFAIVGAGLLTLAALWHTFTRKPQITWGALAATVPVSTFAYSFLRVADFERSVPFAMTGLGLAALFGTVTERLDRRDLLSDVALPDRSWTVGALAATTCAFIALSLGIAFERGWLTIGLALMAPALAWISLKRPIPILRWVVALLAGAVVARLLWDPRIVGEALGTTPLFNWILYGYGIPTLAFAAAGWLLLRDGDDLPAQITRAAAIAFGVTLVGMELRHLMNGGNVFAARFGLAELATHSVSWLGLSLGLRWGSQRFRDGLMMHAANLVGFAGLIAIAIGHLLTHNPMVTHEALAGGGVFNTLLLAYATPAILCGLIVWQVMGKLANLPAPVVPGLPWTPRSFAEAFALAAGALALVLAFAYLTLQVSRLFQGPSLRFGPSEGELYTWSAVWIAFAVALLAGGVVKQSQILRHAGFAILLISTCKIFLIDMRALTGLLRAVSFIGLGGALIAIGYAYQRIVVQPPQLPEGEEDAVDDPSSPTVT